MSMQQQIHDTLVDLLRPSVLEVINESHMHSGPATESHFKVIVVAERFDGIPLLRRHRLVNQALAEPLGRGVHALSIHAYTPQQWADRGGEIPRSPPCRGGSKASP